MVFLYCFVLQLWHSSQQWSIQKTKCYFLHICLSTGLVCEVIKLIKSIDQYLLSRYFDYLSKSCLCSCSLIHHPYTSFNISSQLMVCRSLSLHSFWAAVHIYYVEVTGNATCLSLYEPISLIDNQEMCDHRRRCGHFLHGRESTAQSGAATEMKGSRWRGQQSTAWN